MLGSLENSKRKIAVETLTLKHSSQHQGKIILSHLFLYFQHILRVKMIQMSLFSDKYHFFNHFEIMLFTTFFCRKVQIRATHYITHEQ